MFWRRERKALMITHLIAGLGNPGREYGKTRHNVGFEVIDLLASRNAVEIKRLKWQSLWCSYGSYLLLKPQTFMNRSGRAVMGAASFYKISPENIIIIQDDTALAPGRLRIRCDGSDGGHNGIKDIIYQLKSDRFIRVKIGVGGKPHPDMDLSAWVLSGFSAGEAALMKESIEKAADAVECILKNGAVQAMNLFNKKNAD
ncbi:MAG: aminoacyl-tRNA hydrolase [Oscillospiraceae bacterium]|nr:aminoacyl-tRNA hydrolase [Oscillospiraceae bacterium]